MAININREVEDAFYRYKMPKLQAKVEGKGNGIKTVIVNITEIARALYRKPIYVTKYFGCELGAQVNVDSKNDRYIINGAHEADKLQQILDGFIKDFVLCPNCNNPETDITVKKNQQTVKATCKACGASKMLDSTHRLTQYILKNPPEPSSSKTTAKSANKISDDEDKEDKAGSNLIDEREVADEDWGEDTSEEAQKNRLQELSSRVKSLAMSADTEKSKADRAQMFFTKVSELFKANELLSQLDDVIEEADRLDLGSRSVLVLTEVILTEHETMIDQLKKYAPLYHQLISASDSPAKSQMNLLNGTVTLVNQYPEMLKKIAVFVKTLYDTDICDEEQILKWAQKGPSSKYGPKKLHSQILSKCKVFFDWLREAEEESDEDDSDYEEDCLKPKCSATNNGDSRKPVESNISDDIDIDAI